MSKLYIDDDRNLDWLHQEEVQKKAKPKGNWLGVYSTPDFSLLDEKAVKAIREKMTFWVDHFYEDLSDEISDTVRETMIEAGESRVAAGKLLRERVLHQLHTFKLPSGYSGTAEKYFEGVAANAATTARAHGQVRSLQELGVKTYTISNPEDSRTCPVCEYMSGKSFKVQQGVEQMDDELDANTPGKVKSRHPWLSLEELQDLDDPDSLAEEGQALPPYHFNCRCVCDIDLDDNENFDHLFED